MHIFCVVDYYSSAHTPIAVGRAVDVNIKNVIYLDGWSYEPATNNRPRHCLPHSEIHTSFSEVISNDYDITHTIHLCVNIYVHVCTCTMCMYTHVSNLVGSLCCTTVNKEDGDVVG